MFYTDVHGTLVIPKTFRWMPCPAAIAHMLENHLECATTSRDPYPGHAYTVKQFLHYLIIHG